MIQHVQSKHEDLLIPGLTYDAEPTASYVEGCRLCRFRPSAGDRFSPNARVIRVALQDHCFLEPSSVRLQFQLNNLDTTNPLVPVGHPGCMFSTLKLYVGGNSVIILSQAAPLHDTR